MKPILVLGGLMLLAGSGSLLSNTRTVTAVLANARGVRVGDPVRFAGLRVGRVDSLEIGHGAAAEDGPADGDDGRHDPTRSVAVEPRYLLVYLRSPLGHGNSRPLK